MINPQNLHRYMLFILNLDKRQLRCCCRTNVQRLADLQGGGENLFQHLAKIPHNNYIIRCCFLPPFDNNLTNNTTNKTYVLPSRPSANLACLLIPYGQLWKITFYTINGGKLPQSWKLPPIRLDGKFALEERLMKISYNFFSCNDWQNQDPLWRCLVKPMF